MQENQSLWRSRRSIATVRSKSEVKRLILKHFEIGVDFLMHISGLIVDKVGNQLEVQFFLPGSLAF